MNKGNLWLRCEIWIRAFSAPISHTQDIRVSLKANSTCANNSASSRSMNSHFSMPVYLLPSPLDFSVKAASDVTERMPDHFSHICMAIERMGCCWQGTIPSTFLFHAVLSHGCNSFPWVSMEQYGGPVNQEQLQCNAILRISDNLWIGFLMQLKHMILFLFNQKKPLILVWEPNGT